MKCLVLASALPLASAFIAPVPSASTAVARGRALRMSTESYPFKDEPAGVKWFPNSAPYWDPLGLVNNYPEKEHYWRLSHGEIKNGRVAMLAVVDYLVKGLGFRFPFTFGGVSAEDIPMGLKAFGVLPKAFWLQIFLLCMFLDIGTEKNAGNYVEGKVPGNVQPDTPSFKAPGDKTIRAKEINNGRLAMVSIFGIWAHELVTGEANPFVNTNLF